MNLQVPKLGLKKKIYMAGGMFSIADQNERHREAKEIRDLIDKLGLSDYYELYVPLEAPINDKANLPTAQDIFLKDLEELRSSQYIIACLDGEDAGVMAELGLAYGKQKIVAYSTDLRQGTAGEYDGIHVPWGYNQFVVGLVEEVGEIHLNVMDAFNAILIENEKENE